MLCPLNAVDPVDFAKATRSTNSLWNTENLEPLDQEYYQSHQIPIENKFIAVEWILKCECSKNVSFY